jgi:hypothetical protein
MGRVGRRVAILPMAKIFAELSQQDRFFGVPLGALRSQMLLACRQVEQAQQQDPKNQKHGAGPIDQGDDRVAKEFASGQSSAQQPDRNGRLPAAVELAATKREFARIRLPISDCAPDADMPSEQSRA